MVDDRLPIDDEESSHPVLNFHRFGPWLDDDYPIVHHSVKKKLAVLNLHEIRTKTIELVPVILICCIQVFLEGEAEPVTLQKF